MYGVASGKGGLGWYIFESKNQIDIRHAGCSVRCMRFFALFGLLATVLTAFATEIAPKVVVVTMFEPGKDTGDTPGEFQFWVERQNRQ